LEKLYTFARHRRIALGAVDLLPGQPGRIPMPQENRAALGDALATCIIKRRALSALKGWRSLRSMSRIPLHFFPAGEARSNPLTLGLLTVTVKACSGPPD